RERPPSPRLARVGAVAAGSVVVWRGTPKHSASPPGSAGPKGTTKHAYLVFVCGDKFSAMAGVGEGFRRRMVRLRGSDFTLYIRHLHIRWCIAAAAAHTWMMSARPLSRTIAD